MTGTRVSAIAAGATAVALLSGVNWWWTQTKRQEAVEKSASSLIAAKPADKEKMKSYPRSVLADNAAVAPLSQRRFNQFVVAASERRELAGQPLDDAMTQLASLGWRDTASLQNQIYFHANRGEIGETLDNVDALLRRDKLADDVLAALSMAETDPKFRTVLIERMLKGASWTSRFLQFNGLLNRAPNVAARTITLKALVDGKARISRQDMASSLIPIVAAGNFAEGYEIWQGWRGAAANDPRGFDHDFRLAAALPEEERDIRIPFEWMLENGPGYRASASGSGVGSSLNIRWNGRGTPTLMQRFLKNPGGDWFLRVRGLDLTAGSIRNLRFNIACPSQRLVEMTIRMSDQKQGLALIPDAPVNCPYPALLVRGQARDAGALSQEWTVFDISIERS